MQTVQTLWAEHEASPFPPRSRGVEFDGVDLVLLDAEVAGCVTTFLGNLGQLDDERRRVLEWSLGELRRIEPRLKGEAGIYFTRLRQVVQETLRCLDTSG